MWGGFRDDFPGEYVEEYKQRSNLAGRKIHSGFRYSPWTDLPPSDVITERCLHGDGLIHSDIREVVKEVQPNNRLNRTKSKHKITRMNLKISYTLTWVNCM